MPDYESFPPTMVRDWEAFLDGRLEPQDTFAWPSLMPLQRRRELRLMIAIGATCGPQTYMEIGCDKASTMYEWLKATPTIRRVIACEFRGCPYKELFGAAFPDIRFLWLEESSYTPAAVTKVRQFLGAEPLDIVFIDGDKGAFRQDFDCYSPLVRPGGMVFMHDVYDRSGTSVCAKAFRELAKTRPASTVIDITESVQAKQRAQAGVPSTGCHEDWLRESGRDCGFGVIYI